MVAWNIIIGLLLTVPLVAAGLAVALTWAPPESKDDTPLFHVCIALGWAFGLVPFLAFSVVLFTGVPLDPVITLGAAVLVTVIAGGYWWFRQARVIPTQLRSGWREVRWVILACLMVSLIYLFKYDRSVFFLESCIHRVVMQTLQLTDQPIDILSSNRDDQRLGNTSVISSFVVLYRGLGFRLLYALVGFMMALGGYLLGRRVLGTAAWGWALLLFLPLNPYVAKIPLLDENLLTLGFSSLFLPLLLRRQVPWGHVGAFFGLAVMMRHMGILCAPAIIWAVWTHRGRRLRSFWTGFATFNVVTLVGHIHHYVALGSITRFESFGQIGPFPHRFLGPYEGLLQWPFAEHVIRTPWNPLPTALLWPAYLADHFGLLLFAAMLVGSVALVVRKRREGVFWWAWIGLAYLALSVQENWDVPNKMGVIYVLFHPFVIWAAFGLWISIHAPRTWGVAFVAVALLSGFGLHSLRHLDVPADTRYYEHWAGEREEDPAYVRAELLRITDVDPWPDYGRLGPFSRVFEWQKVSGLVADLQDPSIDTTGTPYGWFPGESTNLNQSVAIELDLSQRLFDRDPNFVRRLEDSATVDVDLSTPGPPVVIPNIRVSWTSRPVSVLFSRGQAQVTGVALIFEEWPTRERPVPCQEAESFEVDPRRCTLWDRYHRGLMMVLGWEAHDLLQAELVHVGGSRVSIRGPGGPISIVESVNNAGQNYLIWRAQLHPDEAVSLQGPHRVFHN